MKKHITHFKQWIHDKVGNGVDADEELLEECLGAIKDTLRAQLKGRGLQKLSPSGTSATERQMWCMENGVETTNRDQFKQATRLKMIVSSVAEHTIVYLMKEAGIPIERCQERTETNLGEITLRGSWDYVLDGEVVDFKCTSDENYKDKFKSSKSLSESDPFGYKAQLSIYAQGAGLPAGGWHVYNLNTGDIKAIPFKGLEESADFEVHEFTNRLTESRKYDSVEDIPVCQFPQNHWHKGNPYVNGSGELQVAWNCARCNYLDKCWPNNKKTKQSIDKVRVVIEDNQTRDS